ncbi:hypothetical protein CRX69_25040 [Pseudomonas rhizophila]|uniref:Uncharacterized protein n=1 Tax=Pseudomonas rhizophila TaxID=2045200 RepID=A0ABM6UL67_9PSED|nr:MULTISPECIES: hypothetical protein [Pseudomonas]AVU78277.1 hypothetical protein CRX69_25040 [Pseudomonas rhizophila]KAI2692915.1 hypothetical protein GBC55_008270 [Pseudomonas sp. TNT3]
MSKTFDMELFLASVLTGSYTTRQRHLRQAKIIQTTIVNRWNLENPWIWQRKHLIWFLNNSANNKSTSTHYYYVLTARLIVSRLKKGWRLPK